MALTQPMSNSTSRHPNITPPTSNPKSNERFKYYSAKGKKGQENPNYFSNKDLFDWEINEQQQILSKMDTQQVNLTTKTKFIFESSVFKKENGPVDDKKSALKKVEQPRGENGNILTWKGGKSENGPVKEIKRRDPNAPSGTDCSTKSPKKKVLKMHESSDENALNRKK